MYINTNIIFSSIYFYKYNITEIQNIINNNNNNNNNIWCILILILFLVVYFL